jgi:uncharacterized protein with HEPN domain
MPAYCEDIEKTMERFGNNYSVFESDKDYRNSVSMSIMQIGELSIGLSEVFKEQTKAEMPWVAMRGMRNICAHEYGKADSKILWEVATFNIPQLKEFCESVLQRF